MTLTTGLFTSNTAEWATPQAFFDELNEEFHFDLDIAASDDNHKCARYYTKETDGLAHQDEWSGTVWCNPPYGRVIGDWVEACAKYNKGQCVMLLPARTDTRWSTIGSTATKALRYASLKVGYTLTRASSQLHSQVW